MLEGLRKMEGILPDGCSLSNFQEGKNVCYDNVYALANIYLKENFQYDRVQERF
jgi:hypothetical protein